MGNWVLTEPENDLWLEAKNKKTGETFAVFFFEACYDSHQKTLNHLIDFMDKMDDESEKYKNDGVPLVIHYPFQSPKLSRDRQNVLMQSSDEAIKLIGTVGGYILTLHLQQGESPYFISIQRSLQRCIEYMDAVWYDEFKFHTEWPNSQDWTDRSFIRREWDKYRMTEEQLQDIFDYYGVLPYAEDRKDDSACTCANITNNNDRDNLPF